MGLSLNDGLQITEDMERPFSIVFVSFDKARKIGGEAISLQNCKRVGASHNMKENDTISIQQIGLDRHPYTVHTHLILEINEQKIFI